ncbi:MULTISPECIES: sporulation integral membrane protein YtvI [Lysinibacillus]|uniref:Sporulation integral membrane protein YtvI n=1 Tax=Lysinibacillus fusiformis TaxID=28031 RepID=A0A2I0V5A2_9BACI|nr:MULTISPECIES: sporulation integral membrane protein YtvI [Lysinibacillus]PKU53402.1 sporulation integral membrane protein YtvI [Lysinibacillus fusiformis]SCX79167.1 sporulation integral membrane protein YtvI [Lysinibacillus sp. SG9]SDB03140.1 sporulation integral membrane protein YtvI [Lysinibacillus sp. TC-37]SFS31441.1 sporulation integral membrane protein YtvI [Lysinibacillus sp. SG55]
MLSFFNRPFFRHPIIVIAIGLLLLWFISISLPILLAYLTALLLEPIIVRMCKRFRKKRKIVVFIFFLFFLSISLLLCTLILYISWKQFSSFIIDIPEYLNQLSALWIQMQSKLSNYTYHLPVELVLQIQFMIENALASIEKFAISLTNVNVLSTLLTYIPSLLFDVFVYWIVLYMLLLDLPAINRKLLMPFPFHYHQKIIFIGQRVKLALFGFLKAQLLVGASIFAISFAAFYYLKTPFPILLALSLVVLDFIPFLDSFILLVPWAIYQVFVGDYIYAVVLTLLNVGQFLVRRMIEPKIIGDKIGLSSLNTFIAMFIGFKIFGFLGILIGPLLVVVILSIFQPTTKNLPPLQ